MGQGGRRARLVVLEGDPGAAPVVELAEEALVREVADVSGLGVGDRVAAVRIEDERPALTVAGEYGDSGLGMRVGEQAAVLADEDHAFLVDLQTLVDRGRPGRPEPAARAVRRLEGAGEDERQRAREDQVGLRQDHPARRHVDRVAVALQARLAASGGLGFGLRRRPRRFLARRLLGEPHPGPEGGQALGADEIGEDAALEFAGVRHVAVDHRAGDALGVGRGGDETGQRHVEVLLEVGRVRQVEDVEGVHAACEVQRSRRALRHAAHDVGELEHLRARVVADLGHQPVRRRHLRRGVLHGRLERAFGRHGRLVALPAGLFQDLLGPLEGCRARIGALDRDRAGITAGLRGRLVGVLLGDVRVVGFLRRLHRGLVQVDGRLGLLLRPFHRLRVPVERSACRLARVGRAQPVGGMHGELRAERVGRLPLPLVRVEGLHALADPLERRLEVRQMLGRLPERRRLAVNQLVGLLALAELLFAYRGTETGRGVVTEVLDRVRPAVRAGTVEDAADLVGGSVDAVTDDLLG